jgi:hypothetical protein
VPALRRSVSYPSPWPAGVLNPFTAAAVGEEKAPAIRAGAEACRRRTTDAGNGAGGCAVLLYGQYGGPVREVAAVLRISKSEAGRLRQRAVEEGLLGRNGGTEDQASIIRLVPSSPTVGE